METVNAILKAMDEVIGLDSDEMKDMLDENLFETGLVDSLSVISLLQNIEETVGYKIDIKKMSPADFVTVNTMAKAIELQR